MRSATSGPMASALDRAYANAVAAKSTAVTCHPRAASQSVSDPWPQPASSARPGRRSPSSAVRWAFAGRCATRSPCSRRACDQRSSQEFRSYPLMAAGGAGLIPPGARALHAFDVVLVHPHLRELVLPVGSVDADRLPAGLRIPDQLTSNSGKRRTLSYVAL